MGLGMHLHRSGPVQAIVDRSMCAIHSVASLIVLLPKKRRSTKSYDHDIDQIGSDLGGRTGGAYAAVLD